jgi:flagellar motor switch protein FliG
MEFLLVMVKPHNMTKEEFEKIVNELEDLKNLPNSKLIEIMDNLTTEFEFTKNTIIGLTLYLDKVEEFYNKSLDEYQSRNNGK